MLFTRKRKLPNIELKIEEGNILFKNEFNNLGVYFQTYGTYNKHTKYVSDSCSEHMNILRHVKDTSWGVSKDMLALYRALIRSIVEYGMEAYFNPSIAHDIQKIQNEACGCALVRCKASKYGLFCTIVLKYLLLSNINNCV